MNLNEYQDRALATAITEDVETDFCHFGFGLMAEAGEVANIFQKYFRKDTRYNRWVEWADNNIYADWTDEDTKNTTEPDWGMLTPEALTMVEKELGDVLWHVAALAHTFGLSLDSVANTNLKKLENRTKNGTIKGDGDDR